MSNPQSSSIWIVVNPCILVDSQTYEFPGEHCHRSSNIPIINKQFSQKSRLKWPYGSIWLVLYPTISSYIPIYLVADIRISHQKKHSSHWFSHNGIRTSDWCPGSSPKVLRRGSGPPLSHVPLAAPGHGKFSGWIHSLQVELHPQVFADSSDGFIPRVSWVSTWNLSWVSANPHAIRGKFSTHIHKSSLITWGLAQELQLGKFH